MSTASAKRRLQLMPEVLPAPQRVEGRPEPRARILERMRQLAQAAPPAAHGDEGDADLMVDVMKEEAR